MFITMVKVRPFLLVMLCLLLYCSFNFMYSLFYEPAKTTTKLPFAGFFFFFNLNSVTDHHFFTFGFRCWDRLR